MAQQSLVSVSEVTLGIQPGFSAEMGDLIGVLQATHAGKLQPGHPFVGRRNGYQRKLKKSNSRSGVALAMRHRRSGVSTERIDRLYAPSEVRSTCNFFYQSKSR